MKTIWDKIMEKRTSEQVASLEQLQLWNSFPKLRFKGMTEYSEILNQLLPMNEQFTDEDIEEAKRAKSDGCVYLARDEKADYVLLFQKKPKLKYNSINGYYWGNSDFEDKLYNCFKYITYKDGLIKLDDIIHSREK